MISHKFFLLLVILGLFMVLIYFQMQISKVEYTKEMLESRIARVQAENQHLHEVTRLLDEDDDLVVVYNRVPKTGSTSFVGVPYDLCKRNRFHVLHINVTANMHVLSLPNQLEIVRNITRWNEMKPALYHGHIAFLDFTKLGALTKPLYINIIRQPLERLVSYYYFLRYGDNFRPYLVRKKHGDKMSFDECVAQNQPDCDPNNMWLQVPFLCGHAAECWQPGNDWALREAKKNLVNQYLLVGVTDQLGEFIAILEATMPRMFNGALEHYLHSNKTHLRKTAQKSKPSERTIAKIERSIVWKMENDLYEFALKQFNFVKKKILTERGRINRGYQRFFFEKIRPK